MKSTLGVAVFARTPGSGGKSRLAATLGRQRTDQFYAHCLDCASEWLKQARQVATGYWALTGNRQQQTRFQQSGAILWQPDSDLGSRMAAIADQLLHHHRHWCLVGTDIPQMPALSALGINEQLTHHDFLLGPANDGGFWLVAGREQIPTEVWRSTPYSTPHTCHRFRQALVQTLPTATVHLLSRRFTDIDSEEHLLQLYHHLGSRQAELGPAQRQLLAWLTTLYGPLS